MIKEISDLDQDLSLAIERIDKLENSSFLKSSTYAPLFEKLGKIENRIDEIELLNLSFREHNQVWVESNIKNIHQRIDDLEKALENYREYRTSIEDLETDGIYIKKRIEKLELIPMIRGKEGTCYEMENICKEIDSLKEANISLRSRIDELEKICSRKPELSFSPEGVKLYFEQIISPIEDKIEKLESHYYSDGDLSAIHGQLQNLHKNMDFDEHQRKKLESRIDGLEKKLTDFFTILASKKHNKKPHKCPACNALGFRTIYDDPLHPLNNPCKPCKGEGIVWD
ncbi:MAG TPA: hypothetical protein VJ279_08600 [Hanamia sp.]|jgi:hypothetical protein|nr:hypothetical protein [Hanamia sp.]